MRKTPVRAALVDASALQERVEDGLGAMKKSDKGFIEDALKPAFVDSIDIDAAFREGNEQENRWDYLLGHGAEGIVVGLEPHSAKGAEISTVIAKRRAALDQLKPHLRDGAKITAWFWAASGPVHFADTEKARRTLDQNGIQFVGKCLRAAHLPKSTPRQVSNARSRQGARR